MHTLLGMGSIFCEKFQMCPLKFHTKLWTHTLQNMHFMRCLKFDELCYLQVMTFKSKWDGPRIIREWRWGWGWNVAARSAFFMFTTRIYKIDRIPANPLRRNITLIRRQCVPFSLSCDSHDIGFWIHRHRSTLLPVVGTVQQANF